jgi:hypothetical protein
MAPEHVSETLEFGSPFDRVINLAYNDRSRLEDFACMGGYCNYCEIGETGEIGV